MAERAEQDGRASDASASERDGCDEHPKFSLVSHPRKGIGRVLRTDHFGVFVMWDTEVSYAQPDDLTSLVGTAAGDYVADLLAIIRWLHPDEQVDPRSMKTARREIGDHRAVLLNDVVWDRSEAR